MTDNIRLQHPTYSSKRINSTPLREEHWALRERLMEEFPQLEVVKEGRGASGKGEMYYSFFEDCPQTVFLETKNGGIHAVFGATRGFLHVLSVDGWKHPVTKDGAFPTKLMEDLGKEPKAFVPMPDPLQEVQPTRDSRGRFLSRRANTQEVQEVTVHKTAAKLPEPDVQSDQMLQVAAELAQMRADQAELKVLKDLHEEVIESLAGMTVERDALKGKAELATKTLSEVLRERDSLREKEDQLRNEIEEQRASADLDSEYQDGELDSKVREVERLTAQVKDLSEENDRLVAKLQEKPAAAPDKDLVGLMEEQEAVSKLEKLGFPVGHAILVRLTDGQRSAIAALEDGDLAKAGENLGLHRPFISAELGAVFETIDLLAEQQEVKRVADERIKELMGNK